MIDATVIHALLDTGSRLMAAQGSLTLAIRTEGSPALRDIFNGFLRAQMESCAAHNRARGELAEELSRLRDALDSLHAELAREREKHCNVESFGLRARSPETRVQMNKFERR